MASCPGISGAAGVANHVHRRPDEHRRRWDQHGLVIRSSHRLPSGDVAVLKRLMIHVLSPATEVLLLPKMICGQFYERQCSIS
jgi:hypothetical protein